MSKPHPHAESMALYAADAAETEEPWVRWEVKNPERGRDEFVSEWVSLKGHPRWVPKMRYRRKPRVVSLNGFEYPEPERTPPADGTAYWIPALPIHSFLSVGSIWSSCLTEFSQLRRGMIHLTKEGAEAHARAIILAGGGEP